MGRFTPSAGSTSEECGCWKSPPALSADCARECCDLAHQALGLEELIIRHALGEPVEGETLAEGGSAVMMIPIPRAGIYASVRGVEEALKVPGIESVEITAVPGQRLVPLPEGSSYLGFIFARGLSPGEAEASVRAAHGKLGFDVQTALNLL